MDESERPLRADAQRNRDAIITAARRVFAVEGGSVTLEHIAEEAGVGVGTIYRRFASVDDLLVVVLEEKMAEYADRSELAAELAIDDAWAAFSDYVEFVLDAQAADRAFSATILDPRAASEVFRDHIRRALAATILLTERAQAAGAVRPDFHHSDFYVLLSANAGVLSGIGRHAPAASRRLAHYLLQSFRRVDSAPLPAPPPGWMRAGTSRDR